MAFTKTQICNLALSRGGISYRIADIDLTSDRSEEAVECRLWYDLCREFVLKEVDWNVARRRTALALSPTDPPAIWGYSYLYPNNCLEIRELMLPGIRWPRKDQRIPYEVANDGTGKVIYTDLVDAEAIWTLNLTDTSFFDAQLVSTIAYLLTSEIAIPLSVKPDMAAQARAGYQFMINKAAVSNAREGETGPEPDSEYMAFRNGG